MRIPFEGKNSHREKKTGTLEDPKKKGRPSEKKEGGRKRLDIKGRGLEVVYVSTVGGWDVRKKSPPKSKKEKEYGRGIDPRGGGPCPGGEETVGGARKGILCPPGRKEKRKTNAAGEGGSGDRGKRLFQPYCSRGTASHHL